MSRKLTGVGAVLSAAHVSRDRKSTHGHTWEIVAWFPAKNDALMLQYSLNEEVGRLDHSILPDELAWGEELAAYIGRMLQELGCIAVDVSRPSERIFARWER